MGDELLHVEEKAKRKAEKRRAKKKRQKERRRIEQTESGLAGTLLTLRIQDSSSDDDEGEEGEDAEEDEEEEEEEVERHLEDLNGLNRNCDPNFGVQTNGDDCSRRRHSADRKSKTKKSRGKSTVELGEQDAEWDVNSAFFAVAASHVKALQKPSKADKKRRSEASMMEAKDPDSDSLKSREYLLLGNDRAQNGQYSEAVQCFSKAISIDPNDYRPFGNRSYCYDMLRQFPKALKDADVALELFPGWAKGHFRRGRALLGLEKYKQAEEAFKRVLDLDKDCDDAVDALFSIKVERLMDQGFTREDSEKALNQEESFEAAHNFLVNSTEYLETMDISNGSDSDIFHNNHVGHTSRMEANSLWIGNVTSNVTEKAIMDLFKRYGTIRSVRVMHERYCAFVNYTNGEAAAKAMSALQGCEVANTKLLIKYPDHHPSNTPKAESKASNIPLSGDKKRGPINGNECYFWRTTGCTFEDRCRFRHVPENRSVDLKPWQRFK
ncbi:uncharacterized protein LOC144931539 isoform X1 [Lampetra fluviatilis]